MEVVFSDSERAAKGGHLCQASGDSGGCTEKAILSSFIHHGWYT